MVDGIWDVEVVEVVPVVEVGMDEEEQGEIAVVSGPEADAPVAAVMVKVAAAGLGIVVSWEVVVAVVVMRSYLSSSILDFNTWRWYSMLLTSALPAPVPAWFLRLLLASFGDRTLEEPIARWVMKAL